MFIDTAKIYLKAGDGGNGCHSFERDQAGRKLRSDGGPGGKGGDIYLRVDENVRTLLDFQYRRHFEAGRGAHGSSNNKKGAFGEDLFIKVPAGTIVKDFQTGEVLADLVAPDAVLLAAKAGAGGTGNSRFRPAEKGYPGQEKMVLLELRLIADVGIVGYPNAGKSTLISRISKARPKIALYPFTTKEPVLGVAKVGDFEFVVADIPGLIEGAHSGKGLGDKFLRHIERTNALIHLVDIAAFDGRDPVKDYRALNREMGLYSKALLHKPQVIAANKMDMGENAKKNLKRLRQALKTKKVMPISALNGEGLDELLAETVKKLRQIKRDA